MSTNTNHNRPLSQADQMGMHLRLPMSRRDALRVSLFSTAGLLVGGRSSLGAEEGEMRPGGQRTKTMRSYLSGPSP